jgi:hypothetical protein
VNNFQPIFDKQKDYFNTDATKSYEWRIEQLDRMANTALISRPAARACSISSKAFRQRSSTSQERSWPKEIS